MRKYIIIILFLFSGFTNLFSTSEIDSLIKILDFQLIEEHFTNAHSSCRILGKLCFDQGKSDKAIKYYQKALELSEQLGENNEIMTDLFQLGTSFQELKEYEQALRSYFRMLDITEKNSDLSIEPDVLVKIANIYQTLGHFDMAYDYQFVALDIQQRRDDSLGIANSMLVLGNIFYNQEKYELSLKYFEKSLDYFLSFQLRNELLQCLTGISDVYQFLDFPEGVEELSLALENHYNALKFAQAINDENIATMAYLNIGTIYIGLKDYAKAAENLNASLKKFKDLNDKQGIQKSLKAFGQLNLHHQKYSASIDYFEEALNIATETNQNTQRSNLYKLLSKVYFNNQKFAIAYDFMAKHNDLKDSINREKLRQQSGKPITRYETQKQENEINLLKKENEIFEKDKKIADLNSYILIGTVIFLFLLSALLYSRYRVQRESNKLLEEKNREIFHQKKQLVQSNEDLKQFAYVASHDLKEPLRMIGSYTSLIKKRYGAILDDSAEEFFEFITDGVNRMNTMLTDLLAYSKVNSDQRKSEKIAIDEVIKIVLSNLEKQIDESQAVISVNLGKSIFVEANKTQMIQLFQNLISNALKFQGDDLPQIEINGLKQETGFLFSVKDNGIGIDSGDKEKIFEMFKRLHGKGEYEGTGIGLATVKRIIERHDGEIWVESESGQGCTFYFTLPFCGSSPKTIITEKEQLVVAG